MKKTEDEFPVPPPSSVQVDFSELRCPECDWQPGASDRWRCACGHSWNTFETRGLCPLCSTQQQETLCPECETSSPLTGWYGESDADEEDEDEDESDGAPAERAEFMKAMTPSPELARIVGAEPLTRVEVTKRVWGYIKDHRLQDKKDRRMINADAALRAVVGADQVNMFELTRHLMAHLT